MTIALVCRVNDGVVLASDSATTIQVKDRDGNLASHVYDHADKVFNLRKGSPIGAAVYGLGNIDEASLTTLMKDLRKRFSTTGSKWHVDPDGYTVEQVATKVKEFFFDEKYTPWITKLGLAKDKWPGLGIIVAGYSAGADKPDVWSATTAGGVTTLNAVADPLVFGGQPEAISRLIKGYDSAVPGLLASQLKLPEKDVQQALAAVGPKLEPSILPMAIPVQDAIDLARFLVELTSSYSRYTPGYQSVGGPIDIAAITKHEGFKWVQRKHYYSAMLNPEGTA